MPGNKVKAITQIKDGFFKWKQFLDFPVSFPYLQKPTIRGFDFEGLILHYHQQLSSNQLQKRKHVLISHLPLHPIHVRSLNTRPMQVN
jgi:hypothetical protein